MLVHKQPKKSNNDIRYTLSNNTLAPSAIAGKAIKKTKPLREKLIKNLSQLPISLPTDSKENASMANIMMVRPHSSMVGSDVSGSLSKSRERADLSKQKSRLKKISSKRNTLGFVDTQIKMKRGSVNSNSQSRWNNRSMDEDPKQIKILMAENRKKYNLSCGDAIQSKSRGKENLIKPIKKKTVVPKQKNSKTQSKKVIKKPESEVKKQKNKSNVLGGKSKGSTAAINISGLMHKNKKKQRQPRENLKKNRSKSRSKSKSKNIKSKKMFVFSKSQSEQQKQNAEQQYPVNKYVSIKKKNKQSFNIKVGLDRLKIPSNGSDVYIDPSKQYQQRERNNVNNGPHQGVVVNYEPSGTINIDQIKYYESHSPFRHQSVVMKRRPLLQEVAQELQQEYPYLNSTELSFLSSVVFIQRRWRSFKLYRQLNQRKQIVTEYIVEEGVNVSRVAQEKPRDGDRDQKDNGEVSEIKGEKVQQMSRTKVAEFEEMDDCRAMTVSKNKREIGDDQEETRKNSMKVEPAVIQFEESPRQGLKIGEEIQQYSVTDRKPKTQLNNYTVNYTWMLTKQVFPEINYLQYRRNLLRQEFEKTISVINQQKLNRTISEHQFQSRKSDLLRKYELDVSALKKTKHDIKKGYLKYIDCLQKIKEIRNENEVTRKLDNKYGLRKVSSESNFLSSLYEKIFKFDNCLSEWSAGSESIEMLTKKILIRKESGGLANGHRRSLEHIRSASRNNYDLINSSRDQSRNTFNLLQNSQRLQISNALNRSSENQFLGSENRDIREFKFSNEILPPSQAQSSESEEQDLSKSCLGHKQPPNRIAILTNSVPLVKNYQAVAASVQDLVLVDLARELERDIHRINPVLMDLLLISQSEQLSQFEQVDVDEEDEEQSPALQFLKNELASMNSPRASSAPRIRNSHNQPEHIMAYLQRLVEYIEQKQWIVDIAANMNNNQTFEPITYLRFLRDFQIPDDQFVPIISNQRFIEWESVYCADEGPESARSGQWSSDIARQCRNIFHRCIFEVFLGELERSRPYGERGRPFPWENNYSFMTVRQIPAQNLPLILQKCLNRVREYLVFGCGLISQKYLIGSEEELEKAHQDNEERIIEMLEQDLVESPHQWYELEEHLLEIRLQLAFLVEEHLLDQIAAWVYG